MSNIYNNLNENSTSIPQPIGLNIELMEHQKKAIYALLQLEKNGYVDVQKFLFYDNVEKDLRIDTRIGILGDIVGSGKSLMIVGLLLLSDATPKKEIYYSSDKYVSIKGMSDNYIYSNCNIIIVHDHLVDQWNKFFGLAPSIKTQILPKKIKSDDCVFDSDTKVCILPFSSVEKFFEKYPKTLWNRVIIDEADSIKLKPFDILANFIWLITGTYNGISVSSSKYLKSIFGKNINWIVDMILVKNNNEYINKSINLPIAKKIIINCYTPPELKIIGDIIPPSIVQMINAGNTDQAILTLNCNVDTKDNIFQVISNAIENTIKNKELELDCETKKRDRAQNKSIYDFNIKKLEKSIKKLNTRLNTIKNKIRDSQEICPVCMGEMDDRSAVLDCCGTMFCFDCLVLTFKNRKNCQYCLKKITQKSLHIIEKNIKKSSSFIKNNKKINEKLDVLIELINKKKNGKFLVFANYCLTFKKIEEVIKKNKITYAILNNGSKENIEKFKNGKIKVLMLNATNFGAGLNLQEATDVIIYHRFSKETEEQVIGRAQRLGRTEQLNVYYLIHHNESVAFDTSFTFDENSKNDDIMGEFIENIDNIDNVDVVDIVE